MRRLAAVLATALLLCPIAAHAWDDDHRGDRDGERGDHARPERDHDHDRGARGPYGDGRIGGWDHEPPAFRGPDVRMYGRPEAPRPLAYRLSRGRILPPAYRGYIIRDYQAYHLRRPPPGYYWCRSGDDFVLAAFGSGLIFEVISAEGY